LTGKETVKVISINIVYKDRIAYSKYQIRRLKILIAKYTHLNLFLNQIVGVFTPKMQMAQSEPMASASP